MADFNITNQVNQNTNDICQLGIAVEYLLEHGGGGGCSCITSISGPATGAVLVNNPEGSEHIYYTNKLVVNDGDVTVKADLLPQSDFGYSLGSTELRWKNIFVGTGSIHFAVPSGQAKISTDAGNYVYTPYGFATPFANIGAVGPTGTTGGWNLTSSGTPLTTSFDLIAQENTPTGLVGPVYSLIRGGGGAVGPTGATGPTGPMNTVVQQATQEPMGHAVRTDSTISFNSGTRQFTIQPTGSSYDVWVAGTKYTISSAQTVTIDNISGLYYIFFNTSGNLGYSTTFFVWDQQAPTAYIYFNSANPTEYMLFDERHGITMDWATHEYLHRTRGAAIANGFNIFNYTTTGTGNLITDVEFSLTEGTFFDEDLEVNITDGAPGIWSQDLTPTTSPIVYLSGTAWRKNAINAVPLSVGPNSRPYYNGIILGSRALVESDNNKFVIQWVVATNTANTPIIFIMGQDQYTNLGNAQQVTWDSLDLTGFPIVEFRPLYRLIFEVSNNFTNAVKSRLVDVSDIRSFSPLIGTGAPVAIGPTGPTGPAGSAGLTLFLDSAGGVYPEPNGTLLVLPNTGAQTLITTGNIGPVTKQLVATFTTPPNTLVSTVIPPGIWNLGMYASSTASSPGITNFYYEIFYVDANGTSNETQISSLTPPSPTSIVNTSINVYINSLYIPTTTIPDITKRIRIKVYVDIAQNNKSVTFAFRDSSLSSLITTLPVTVAPILGAGVGAIVVNSPTGSNNIYYSTALTVDNSTQITSNASIVPGLDLTYSLGTTALRWKDVRVGTGSVYIGDLRLSSDNQSNLILNGGLYPSADQTLTLGSTAKRWKELYLGPGTLNIAGPTGSTAVATIGSDNNSIAYSQYGFATPFINIGPAVGSTGAVGGWNIASTGTQGTTSFDLVVQQNTATGPIGQIYSLINNPGPTGPTGATGNSGTSGGILFYLDTAGGTAPISNGALINIPNTTTITTVSTPQLSPPNNNYQVITFTTPANFLTSTLIPAGLWEMNIFASTTAPSNFPTFYFSVFSVDADGVSNQTPIAAGTVASSTQIVTSPAQSYIYTLFVPTTVLTSITRRIQVILYVNINRNNTIVSFNFRNGELSHLHTTLPIPMIQGAGTGAILLNNPVNTNTMYYSTNLVVNSGNITANLDLLPGSNITYNLGSSGLHWNSMLATNAICTNLTVNNAGLVNNISTANKSIPITINGQTYYILLATSIV